MHSNYAYEICNNIQSKFLACDRSLEEFIDVIEVKDLKSSVECIIELNQAIYFRSYLSFETTRLVLLNYYSKNGQRFSQCLRDEIQEFLFHFVRWKNIYQWWCNHKNPNVAIVLESVKSNDKRFIQHFRLVSEILIKVGDLEILETLYSSAQFLGRSELNYILGYTLRFIKKNRKRASYKANNEDAGATEKIVKLYDLPLPLIGIFSEFVNDTTAEGSKQFHSTFLKMIRKNVYAIWNVNKNTKADIFNNHASNMFYSEVMDETFTHFMVDDLPPLLKHLMQISQCCPHIAEEYYELVHEILVKTDDRTIVQSMTLLLDIQLKYSQNLRTGLTRYVLQLYINNRSLFIESKLEIWHATNILLLLAVCKNELIKREGMKHTSQIISRIGGLSFDKDLVIRTFEKIFQQLIVRGSIICELFLELCIHWCQNNDKTFKVIGELGIHILYIHSPESRRDILGTSFRIIQQHPVEESKIFFVNIIGALLSSEVGSSITDDLNIVLEGLSNLIDYPEIVAKKLLQIFIPQSMIISQFRDFFLIYFTKQLLSRDMKILSISIYGLCQFFRVYAQISSSQREEYEMSLLKSLRPAFLQHCTARHYLFSMLSETIGSLTPNSAHFLFSMIEENLANILFWKVVGGDVKYVIDFDNLCIQTEHASSIEPLCPMMRLLEVLYFSMSNPVYIQRMASIFLNIFEQIISTAWIHRILSQKDKHIRSEGLIAIMEEYLQLLSSSHPLKGPIIRHFPLAQNILFENYTALTLHSSVDLNTEISTQNSMLTPDAALYIYYEAMQTLYDAVDLELSGEIDIETSHVTWTTLEVVQALRILQFQLSHLSTQTCQKLFDDICGAFLESCNIPLDSPFGYKSELIPILNQVFHSEKHSECFSSRKWVVSKLKTLSLRLLQQLMEWDETISADTLYLLVENQTKSPAVLFSALANEFRKDLISNRSSSDEVAFLNFLEHYAGRNKKIILRSKESELACKIFIRVLSDSGIRRMRKLLILMLEYCPLAIREDCMSLLIDSLTSYNENNSDSNAIIKSVQMYDCVLKTLLQFISFCPPGLSVQHVHDLIDICNKYAADVAVVSKLERTMTRICTLLTKQLRTLDLEMKLFKSNKQMSNDDSESISSQYSITSRSRQLGQGNEVALATPASRPKSPEDYSYFAKFCVQLTQLIEKFIADKYLDRIYFVAASLAILVDNYNTLLSALKDFCSHLKYLGSKEYRVRFPKFQSFDEKQLLVTRKRKRKEKELRKKQIRMVKKAKRLRSMDEMVDVEPEEYGDTYSDLKSFIAT